MGGSNCPCLEFLTALGMFMQLKIVDPFLASILKNLLSTIKEIYKKLDSTAIK